MKLTESALRLTNVRPTFHPFSTAQAVEQLRQLQGLPLTYWERGGTDWRRMPQGYQHDVHQTLIGEGNTAWRAAKDAIRAWAMFPSDWTQVTPKPAIEAGAQVMVSAQLLGLWWHNPARIIYVIDTPTQFGFAYGTLPGHLAQGEELFLVERDEQGQVQYKLRVMSRPANWLSSLARPYMRELQTKFRVESGATVQAYVQEALSPQRQPAQPFGKTPMRSQRRTRQAQAA